MPLPLHVVPVPGHGAEDVLVGADGRVWTGTVDGAIHVYDPASDAVRTVAATGGRPLGLEWLPDGRLLICDAHRGLLALDLTTTAIETLASEDDGVPFLVTNNAAVQADGTIWFSDASRVWGVEDWQSDLIQHTCTGRLLRRSTDGAVEPVLDGLAFANGVALTSGEDAVLVAETGACRIRRLALIGGRLGPATMWVDDLPGHPDNISRGSDGLIWVTISAPADAALRVLRSSPRAVRTLARRLPQWMTPAPPRTARVLALDDEARVVHDLDFDATHWHVATGVREHHGRVWLGSLLESAIAVGDVPRH
ncbi:MAG: SMP-30/gluconolactonase/LRE family protein [Dermatophilaceae bacterium]